MFVIGAFFTNLGLNGQKFLPFILACRILNILAQLIAHMLYLLLCSVDFDGLRLSRSAY